MIREVVSRLEGELIDFRRDLHSHPELSWQEKRTTAQIGHRLERAGLTPHYFDGTGLMVEIGESPRVALRADIDALPLHEATGLPFASTVPEVCHACGHDIHTTVGLGVALVLHELNQTGALPGGVRVIFQPAEETQPGGAGHLMALGVLDGLEEIYTVHCDPKIDVGTIGSRVGPITASSDAIRVTVRSPGGHTSRPHLTGDVVNALGQVITQAGQVLSRRLDTRYGANLTWGMVRAGSAPNAIPTEGVLAGTLRCLDVRGWDEAGELVVQAVEQILVPYGVEADVERMRGLPPVVNSPAEVDRIEAAAREVVGPENVRPTEQSQGGEDFAWFLTRVPGALIRLGTRTPGGATFDLHQGNVVFDERAIAIGVEILARTALSAAGVRN